MAIIVSPPEIVGFSKDVILWRFEDDRAGIIPGIPAEAVLAISDAVPVGSQVVFRWGENDLRFTAVETPGVYGSEFPAYPEFDMGTHEAYVKSLVPFLQNNYFLNEDFLIQADPLTIAGPGGSVTLWTIKITSRIQGAKYNLTKTTFVGGGITPSVIGTDDSTVPNNSVFVEVWMQAADESVFQRKYTAPQTFDSNGIAEFDVAPILHSNMAAEIPDMVLRFAQRCTQSRRKYYLRYAMAGGENFSIGPISETSEYIVLLGGFAQWKQGPQSVTDTFKISETQSRLLILRSALRVIRQDEPVFVSWVNFGAAGRTVHALATIVFDDNTELTTNTDVVSSIQQYDKLIFGVGFSQLNLGYFNGTGRSVKEYTVQLRDNTGPVSDAYRLVVNYAHQEFVRYFGYVNSYGAYDTLSSFGQGSSNWKIFKEQAEKVLPYSFNSKEAQYVEWNLQYQDNQAVATGWMKKKELKMWLDLFISPLKYRIIKGGAYAIIVNSDTIQRGVDGDNLYALTFEYQYSRIFDSLSEEEMEGEDMQDYIPANVVLAGSIGSGTSTDTGGNTPVIRVDPYPVQNSSNPISSSGVFNALALLQKKLPEGDSTQYLTGELKLRNMRQAVNSNEIDPTVPVFSKSLTSLNVIFNLLQALNPGLDVNLFGGQIADWYIKKMTHPEFLEIPPIVVQKGVPFDKFVDLSIYKTSYHQLTDLSVSVKYNGLFLEGVELTKEGGLILRVKGELPTKFDAETQLLVTVKDQNGNPTTVGLRIAVLEEEVPEEPENPEEPEQPDNRPLCGNGPFHFIGTAIQVFNNGKIRVPFDAAGVPQLRWKIVNLETDVEPLRQGVSMNDNGPFFIAEFSELPGKTYKIGIQGDLCKSPWVYRDLVLPVNNTLNWTTGYPKYNVQEAFSEFLAKVDQTGQFLTELINTATNTKLYSQMHDYIANVSEVQIWKGPVWPDGNYLLSVGPLSKAIKVGNPVEPAAYQFQMVEGYAGSSFWNLALGPYKGKGPSLGYNIVFSSNNLGFQFTSYSWNFFDEVNGSFQKVTSVGGENFVGSGTTNKLTNPIRLFNLNVDSRLVQWNGKSLNSPGKRKIVIEFKNGSAVVGTYQQTLEMNEIRILGQWTNVPQQPNGRVIPVLNRVEYNGANVFNGGAYIEPWASSGLGDGNFEYSLDKQNWYGTGVHFGLVGGVSTPMVRLNNAQSADQFPAGTNKTIYLRNGLDHSVVSDGYQINQAGAVALFGTYQSIVNGRHLTYQKSPGLVLTLNPDGTITDNTPGTVHGTNGGLTTCNGKNVFYMVRYRHFCSNGDGARSYKSLKNIYFRDSLETVSRFDCNPSAIPDFAAFQAGISGYPQSTGVNSYNAVLSQVTLTLHTLSNPGIPLWLIVSRKLNFLNYIPNRAISKKVFAIERINRGDAPSLYWAKDVRTQTEFNGSVSQRNTFRTYKWPWDWHPGMPLFTDSDLYNSLRGHINAWDLGPESIITDEYPENAQGGDGAIGSRVGLAYKGAFELMQEKFPGFKKIDSGLFGSYGGDNYYGLIDQAFYTKYPRATVAEYLSTKVHKAWDINTASFTPNDCAFYESDQHKYRNVNIEFYMYLGKGLYNVPLMLVFANERIKIGSILKGDECSWMVFGTILSQTLVKNDQGSEMGPEIVRTGDIMPFENGEVLSRYNTPIAGNASEHWDIGFWSAFIGKRGTALWDGGGSYGQDPKKIFTYLPAEQWIRWTPTGGNEQPYVSGQNGAPELSVEGMADTLYATVVDATMAGHQAALELEGYDNILYYASYTSSRKTFVATPGENGFQLSGNGVANIGMLAMVDAASQKASTSIIAQGPLGRVGVYNNGFLSVDEYEENVTLSHGNWTVTIPGRIYGGQTKYVKF